MSRVGISRVGGRRTFRLRRKEDGKKSPPHLSSVAVFLKGSKWSGPYVDVVLLLNVYPLLRKEISTHLSSVAVFLKGISSKWSGSPM